MNKPKPKHFFWWFAGADIENLEMSSTRARMLHTALGVAFLVNFIVLGVIWSKVGILYFGLVGGLVLGIAIPCGFILGMDRIIAMSHRPRNGVLDNYGIKDKENKASNSALYLRIFVSIFLTLAFNFYFSVTAKSLTDN